MSFIGGVLGVVANVVGFFQYHYASTRNRYSCRLMGEKKSEKNNKKIIIFRRMGEICVTEMFLDELLDDPLLVAQFNPVDALRIGSASLEEFVFGFSMKEGARRFDKVKEAMIHSVHDVSCRNIFGRADMSNHFMVRPRDSIQKLADKNLYPCKMVGGKISGASTIIIYTLFGRRDGHEASLKKIISNKKLIEKFHPTEAVKFGFISFGDVYFGNSRATG